MLTRAVGRQFRYADLLPSERSTEEKKRQLLGESTGDGTFGCPYFFDNLVSALRRVVSWSCFLET
jgi:hypothetical protein